MMNIRLLLGNFSTTNRLEPDLASKYVAGSGDGVDAAELAYIVNAGAIAGNRQANFVPVLVSGRKERSVEGPDSAR
jgi:hypothetical protein